MSSSLAKSAQPIQNRLTEYGLSCTVVELSDAARTDDFLLISFV